MKKAIQITIGIIISLVCLYFALREIEIKKSIEIIKNIKISYAIISLILGVIIIVFRALRWECFIPLKEPIKKRTIVASVYIGYMASNVLPAKLGEVVRAYVLGAKEGVSKSAVFASVVTERLFDVIIGVIILSVSLIFIPNLPDEVLYAAISLFIISIVGIIILVFLSFNKDFAHKVFNKVFGILPQKISVKLIEFSCNFIDGIGIKNDIKHIFLIFLYTALYLIGQIFTIGFLLAAFDIEASPIIALFIFAVGGFGFAIPSAPSGIGAFELVIVFGLSLIGVDKSTAAPYALLYHIMGIVPITLIGFIFLFILGIDLKSATKR